MKIKSMNDMKNAAKILLDLGAKNVLIKGGHLESKILKDIFVNKKEIAIFTNKKIKTKTLMELDVHYLVQLQPIMDVEKH